MGEIQCGKTKLQPNKPSKNKTAGIYSWLGTAASDHLGNFPQELAICFPTITSNTDLLAATRDKAITSLKNSSNNQVS